MAVPVTPIQTTTTATVPGALGPEIDPVTGLPIEPQAPVLPVPPIDTSTAPIPGLGPIGLTGGTDTPGLSQLPIPPEEEKPDPMERQLALIRKNYPAHAAEIDGETRTPEAPSQAPIGPSFEAPSFQLPQPPGLDTSRSDDALEKLRQGAERQGQIFERQGELQAEAERKKQAVLEQRALADEAERLRSEAQAKERQRLFDESKTADETYAKEMSSIKPASFFAEGDTAGGVFGNIGKVLAVVLGGLTSHLTGGRNLALDLFDQMLKDDIRAQQTKLGSIRDKRDVARNYYAQALATFGDVEMAKRAAYVAGLRKIDHMIDQIDGSTNVEGARERAKLLKEQIAQRIGEQELTRSQYLEAKIAAHENAKYAAALPFYIQQAQRGALIEKARSGDTAAIIELRVPENLRKEAYKELKQAQLVDQAIAETRRIYKSIREGGIDQGIWKTGARDRYKAQVSSLVAQMYAVSGKQVSDAEIEKVIDPKIPSAIFQSKEGNRKQEEEFINMLKSKVSVPVLESHGLYRR